MWQDFNHAWLGLFYLQGVNTEANEQVQPLQSILLKTEIESMGDKLTRLCDGLEGSGLIDY